MSEIYYYETILDVELNDISLIYNNSHLIKYSDVLDIGHMQHLFKNKLIN